MFSPEVYATGKDSSQADDSSVREEAAIDNSKRWMARESSMKAVNSVRDLCLRFANLEVDFAKRELRRDGEFLRLEPKVFDLLQYLLLHRSRVVYKEELLDTLWPNLEVSEASLASCVVRLRRALGEEYCNLIRTHYGKGYRFVGECTEIRSAQDLGYAREEA